MGARAAVEVAIPHMCLRRRVSCSRCRQGIALSAPREHPSPHRSDHADEINQSWLMLEVIALCAACPSGNMIVRSACACGRSICCNTSSATVRPSRCAKRILPEAHPNSVLREAEQTPGRCVTRARCFADMSVLPVISLGLALGAMTSVVWWQSGLHADRLERRPLARDEVFIHA